MNTILKRFVKRIIKLRLLPLLTLSFTALVFLMYLLSSFSAAQAAENQELLKAETGPSVQHLSDRPNILLIVSEDHGSDLGCYGSKDVKTPVLDALAAKGIRFQNRMYPGIKTLPAYLNEAGYRTGCIGKIHVNPESDIPFGFRPPAKSPLLAGNFARKKLPQYTLLADSFFRRSDTPFFLMVNYPDAHFPWKRQVDGMPKNPMSGNDIKSTLPFIESIPQGFALLLPIIITVLKDWMT